MIELPELDAGNEALLCLLKDAWVQAVAERRPELKGALARLGETLVPRRLTGYATRLWCGAELPAGLLLDLALSLSQVYGEATLLLSVPEGEVCGQPAGNVDDCGVWRCAYGQLDDELAELLEG